jgi:hypothetical protein
MRIIPNVKGMPGMDAVALIRKFRIKSKSYRCRKSKKTIHNIRASFY